MTLYFAVKNGVPISHNLTETMVYDMRLSADAVSISIYEQSMFHAHKGRACFCSDCYSQIEENKEIETEKQILFWNKTFS